MVSNAVLQWVMVLLRVKRMPTDDRCKMALSSGTSRKAEAVVKVMCLNPVQF